MRRQDLRAVWKSLSDISPSVLVENGRADLCVPNHFQTLSLGVVRNISSIMGFIGGPSGHPAYSASKGAVRIYTKSAAVRYGPLGIRVNSVHPGYMPPMLNATNANERADKIALTPLRRLGEPIEVAYGVLFLASDEASFVTGTELVIDGGYIAQ